MSAVLLNYLASGLPDSASVPGGWTDPNGTWSVASGVIQRTPTASWQDRPLYRAESFRNGKIIAVTGPKTSGFGQGVIARVDGSLNYYYAYADINDLYFFVVGNGSSTTQIGSTVSWSPVDGHSYVFELILTSTDGTHSDVALHIYDAASVYVDPVSGNVLASQGGAVATPLVTNSVSGDTSGPQATGGWGVNFARLTDSGWSQVVTRTADNDAIAVTNANAFFSPYNWDASTASTSGLAISAAVGACLKTKFTGTAVALILDHGATLNAATASNRYPVIYYSIDDGPVYTTANLWASSGNGGAVQVSSGSTLLSLASGLASGTHTIEIGIAATYASADRWSVPVSAVRLRGLLVDAGATSAAPTLLSGRMLVYGDSITEGIRTRGISTADATYNLFAGDVLLCYARGLAKSLGCEVGIVGWGSQGYATAGSGNVPAQPAAWDLIHAGVSRLTDGLLSPAPDYIFDTLGTNDAGANPSTLATLVAAQLASYRTAAPNAKIIKQVPDGGFARAGITAGFGAYRATTSDAKCVLVDGGESAETGLTNQGSATFESFDGIHLSALSHVRKAALLAGSTVVDFTAADRAKLDAIKTQTDQFTFDGSGNIYADLLRWNGHIVLSDGNSQPAIGTVLSGVTLTSGERSTLAGVVGELVTTDHGSGSYSRNTEPPSASAIADAVWDESLSGHSVSGSAGQELHSAKTQASKITAANVNVIGGYVTGFLTLRQGNTYSDAAGTTIPIPRPDGAAYPADLTGWTVKLIGKAKPDLSADAGTLYFETTLAVVDPAGDQDLELNALAAATTLALAPKINGWAFEIRATKDDLVNSLLSGTLSIVPELRE